MGDYVICDGDTELELMDSVRGYIELGYKPVGGVAIDRLDINMVVFHQAVFNENYS